MRSVALPRRTIWYSAAVNRPAIGRLESFIIMLHLTSPKSELPAVRSLFQQWVFRLFPLAELLQYCGQFLRPVGSDQEFFPFGKRQLQPFIS